jgi:hypothetical protein
MSRLNIKIDMQTRKSIYSPGRGFSEQATCSICEAEAVCIETSEMLVCQPCSALLPDSSLLTGF